MGMPVTTPIVKLIPKNPGPEARRVFVLLAEFDIAVRSAMVFRITMSGARPIVSCGKMIMERDGEGEVKPVKEESLVHD